VHAVDVFDEMLLVVYLIVTEETLEKSADAVTCSKVRGHTGDLLITVLAFDS
jgi:hypothetical protein